MNTIDNNQIVFDKLKEAKNDQENIQVFNFDELCATSEEIYKFKEIVEMINKSEQVITFSRS
jgi:hypothetical protein